MRTNTTKVIFRRIQSADKNMLDELCHDIQSFMGPYGDPGYETLEALTIAFQNGVVIEAVFEGRRVGIAVLTRTRFDHFQPHYHLAYIAIDAANRGLGLGRKMLQEVEKTTNGNVALHVGTHNTNAIAFYQKLGWQINYLRMMPSDLTRQSVK